MNYPTLTTSQLTNAPWIEQTQDSSEEVERTIAITLERKAKVSICPEDDFVQEWENKYYTPSEMLEDYKSMLKAAIDAYGKPTTYAQAKELGQIKCKFRSACGWSETNKEILE